MLVAGVNRLLKVNPSRMFIVPLGLLILMLTSLNFQDFSQENNHILVKMNPSDISDHDLKIDTVTVFDNADQVVQALYQGFFPCGKYSHSIYVKNKDKKLDKPVTFSCDKVADTPVSVRKCPGCGWEQILEDFQRQRNSTSTCDYIWLSSGNSQYVGENGLRYANGDLLPLLSKILKAKDMPSVAVFPEISASGESVDMLLRCELIDFLIPKVGEKFLVSNAIMMRFLHEYSENIFQKDLFVLPFAAEPSYVSVSEGSEYFQFIIEDGFKGMEPSYAPVPQSISTIQENLLYKINNFYDIMMPPISNHPFFYETDLSLFRKEFSSFSIHLFISIIEDSDAKLLGSFLENLRQSDFSFPLLRAVDVTFVMNSDLEENIEDEIASFQEKFLFGSVSMTNFSSAQQSMYDVFARQNFPSLSEFPLILSPCSTLSFDFVNFLGKAIQETYFGSSQTLKGNKLLGISLDVPSNEYTLAQGMISQYPRLYGLLFFPHQLSIMIDQVSKSSIWQSNISSKSDWENLISQYLKEMHRFVIHPKISLFGETTTEISQDDLMTLVGTTEFFHLGEIEGHWNEDPIDNKFTIVIPTTSSRIDILMQVLEKWDTLGEYVDQILLIWNGGLDKSEIVTERKWNVPINIVPFAVRNLNKRFFPFPEIRTEAVLSVDDDIYIGMDDAVLMFKVWQVYKNHMIGFKRSLRTSYHNGELKYWGYSQSQSPKTVKPQDIEGFSLVLTNIAMFHRKYLISYTYMPEPAQELAVFVDKNLNCEDILMNYLIQFDSRVPVVAVEPREYKHLSGTKGLSGRSGHLEQRNECLRLFESKFGDVTLQALGVPRDILKSSI